MISSSSGLRSWFAVVLLFVVGVEAGAGGVPRAECFPLETLPAELRPRAEKILLSLLDGEALYTVVGGLKPVSESFASTAFSVAEPNVEELATLRRILQTFRCGDEYYADMNVFAQAFGGKRRGAAYIVHRPTLRRAVETHPKTFPGYGVTPNSHPAEVMATVEHAPPPDRWRLYGYVFGYPDVAVDFFVSAGLDKTDDGKIAPRRFLNIPVYSRPDGRFVYAVAPDHVETADDRSLRARAAGVLT
ncbi:MAG: hypothetical protein ACRDD1_00940, partial [Planctomycetia bacterium]